MICKTASIFLWVFILLGVGTFKSCNAVKGQGGTQLPTKYCNYYVTDMTCYNSEGEAKFWYYVEQHKPLQQRLSL